MFNKAGVQPVMHLTMTPGAEKNDFFQLWFDPLPRSHSIRDREFLPPHLNVMKVESRSALVVAADPARAPEVMHGAIPKFLATTGGYGLLLPCIHTRDGVQKDS